MKIVLIFFSPTGSTAKISREIKKELLKGKNEVLEYDITKYTDRISKINLQEFDFIFFGFPVYAQRIPKIMRDWIQLINGQEKKCSTFFTYGGITIGVAHQDTKNRLKKQDLEVISSAEFLAKHTFNIGGWRLMEDRPDENDFITARKYARKTIEKATNSRPTSIFLEEKIINKKKLDKLELVPKRGVKLPSRKGLECSMCRKCEDECPNNAMDCIKGIANDDKCIKCLRCVKNCPDNILRINDMTAAFSMIIGSKDPEELKKKESKFYI